ncbi:hypothetical protein LSH36_479g01004 [Paralvinella palmiformis]|uniref:Uncharacterized protein n=1 Tax=Paralvinella palmiformis TaxID=53620 RepID=A0AAD9J9Q8_9ANNE|nr:hypothetical protein LSH36_479g01004 [Paralvinella palmiformis]
MTGSFGITGDELETTYLRIGLNGETEMKLMSMEESNSTTSTDLYSNVQKGKLKHGKQWSFKQNGVKSCIYCNGNLSNFKAMMLLWLIPLCGVRLHWQIWKAVKLGQRRFIRHTGDQGTMWSGCLPEKIGKLIKQTTTLNGVSGTSCPDRSALLQP